jgi:SnoaL-like domain
VIQRWEVEPLRRARRGFDEWLVLAAPWLVRALFPLAARARPGSLLRRALLGRAARVGIAANNRRDYRAMSAWLSPEVELHVYPDAPEMRPVDAETTYHGRDGYVEAVEVLKAGFGDFDWELRELLDPGGDRFGARVDIVARGGLSGADVRAAEFDVWQIERGMARRQWVLSSEAAMLALLAEGEQLRSQT